MVYRGFFLHEIEQAGATQTCHTVALD